MTYERGGKRHGNVSYIRRTVFVFRMWEDEFPWNLGCSIRNCLFFCGLEEPAVRNIQLGAVWKEGSKKGSKKLDGDFLLKFLFYILNTEDRISLFYIVQLFEIENVRNLFFSVINDSAFHWKHLYIDDAVRHSY